MLQLEDSTRKSPYFAKDLAKAKLATKLIARGSAESSSNAYARAVGPLANCGDYLPSDIVLVSTEGNRHGRIDPDFSEISKAIRAGSALLTDRPVDRARAYNLGERQVADYLQAHGYHETAPGFWEPRTRTISAPASQILPKQP